MHTLMLGLELMARSTVTVDHSACGTKYSTLLIANIRAEMHQEVSLHPHVLWQLADTATLKPVTSDSLCRLALETVRSYMDHDLEPRGITLIYAGNYFVAQQLEAAAGSEFTGRYISTAWWIAVILAQSQASISAASPF